MKYTLESKFYVSYVSKVDCHKLQIHHSTVVSIGQLQSVCDLSKSDLDFSQGQLALWIETYLDNLWKNHVCIINFWEI